MAEPTERWHLKKEIQVTHLISTVIIAVSAIMYVNKIDQRVAVLESQVTEQRDSAKETAKIFRDQLDKINDKLDRLIERSKK